VPQEDSVPDAIATFFKNVTIGGVPAPVRAYVEELLPDVPEGRIEPGRVFDRAIGLDGARRLPGNERPGSDQGPDRSLREDADDRMDN
jgi:hypothetical protein